MSHLRAVRDVSADFPTTPFACECTADGSGAAWMHLAGELDNSTAPRLEHALHEAQARVLVLDLRELEFIDGCGVHAIVNASIHARDAGRRLVLLRGSPNIDRVITLTGSERLVEIFDVDPGHPPIQVFLQIAQGEMAS